MLGNADDGSAVHGGKANISNVNAMLLIDTDNISYWSCGVVSHGFFAEQKRGTSLGVGWYARLAMPDDMRGRTKLLREHLTFRVRNRVAQISAQNSGMNHVAVSVQRTRAKEIILILWPLL